MYDFKFADIGEGIHEGRILKWLKNEGDAVTEGETLVIIETDKVNAEIPAPISGKLVKQGAKECETIIVGYTLAMIDDGRSGAKEKQPARESRSRREIEVRTRDAPAREESQALLPKTLATPVLGCSPRNGIDISQARNRRTWPRPERGSS